MPLSLNASQPIFMYDDFQVEDLELVITDIIGSTGLELKSDPGIPYVYAGFGGEQTVLTSSIYPYHKMTGL